jgi:hypothetical protein
MQLKKREMMHMSNCGNSTLLLRRRRQLGFNKLILGTLSKSDNPKDGLNLRRDQFHASRTVTVPVKMTRPTIRRSQ